MELSKVLILVSYLLLPVISWSDRRFRNDRDRDLHFKSSYHDNTFHADKFSKSSGLKKKDDKGKDKEGGRGFFYFEKGGKKLVGYMDYGDGDPRKKSKGDDLWKNDPWKDDNSWKNDKKEKVVTYSAAPGPWKSEWKAATSKKNDNFFTMAKPTENSKIYYFSNNKKVTPQRNKPMIIRRKSRRNRKPRQQHSHSNEESNSASFSGYNLPVDMGEMFDHGYSEVNDKNIFDDIRKRRNDFNDEFDQVQVSSRNKWDNSESRRPMKPKRRVKWHRPRQQEIGMRRMTTPRPRHFYYDIKKPSITQSKPLMVRKREKRVQIMFESDDQKNNNDDYDGRVYVMLPKSSGKKGLNRWINSDFFTDNFIQSFHPSSIDEAAARQGRIPMAKVVKLVPYHPAMYRSRAHHYRV